MKLRMNCRVRSCARECGRTFFRASVVVGLMGLLSLAANAQTSANCTQGSSVPSQVNSTGLAEPIGTIVLTCSGGSSGALVVANLYITLNTNITNNLDGNGNPQGITISSSGAVPVTENSPVLTSATTLEIANISYTVPTPSSLPITITISGIRAAAALVNNGQAPTLVTATLLGFGINLSNIAIPIAIGSPALAASVQNNGFPCTVQPLPSSTDFNSFIAAGIASSAVRITETVPGAFVPQAPGTTNGTRIIVQLSGYGPNAQLWVACGACRKQWTQCRPPAGEFRKHDRQRYLYPECESATFYACQLAPIRMETGGTLAMGVPLGSEARLPV